MEIARCYNSLPPQLCELWCPAVYVILILINLESLKRVFTYLLILSVALNVYFLISKMIIKNQEAEKRKLHFWKDISHKEGYKFYVNKMETEFPEVDLSRKQSFVYIWDSTLYDIKHVNAMRGLDSLASNLGRYTFNYVFATEMDEAAAKQYLLRKGAKFINFKVLGGMDDFISGVYTQNPVKWRRIGPKTNSNEWNSNCPDIRKMKVKGYYLLMDGKGDIVYYNYKKDLPVNDTALMRRMNAAVPVKDIEKLN